MELKAIGFDIDGTLYPEYRIRWRVLPYVLRHLRLFMAFARTRKLMRSSKASDICDANLDYTELAIFAKELGCDIEEARGFRDELIYRAWEKYFQGMKIYPRVSNSLRKLKDAGLKLAVLSDFPVGRKLEYFGLEGIFDAVLGFPESGQLKPHREPFIRMANRLNVDLGNMIYVGNRLTYDVRGSQNAGMRGVLIASSRCRIPREVISYSSFPQLTESILSEVTK